MRNDRKLLPSIDAIRDGLYAIQIGGLDYKAYIGTYKFDPADVVTQVVPLVVQQIRIALEVYLCYLYMCTHLLSTLELSLSYFA